jgi:heat shock protein HslJ
MWLAAVLATTVLATSCGGPLGNSEWTLVGLADSDAPRVEGILSFDLLGGVGGVGPCNLFSGGSYSTSGDAITIDPGFSTLAYCLDGAVMAAEAAYLQALLDARSYRLDAYGLLTLANDQGETIAWFERAGS